MVFSPRKRSPREAGVWGTPHGPLTPIAPDRPAVATSRRPARARSAVWSCFQTKANPMPARPMGLSSCIRKQRQHTRGLARPGAPCDRRDQADRRERVVQGVVAQASRSLPPWWQMQPTLHPPGHRVRACLCPGHRDHPVAAIAAARQPGSAAGHAGGTCWRSKANARRGQCGKAGGAPAAPARDRWLLTRRVPSG